MELILENAAKILLDEYFEENGPMAPCIRIGLRNACGDMGNSLCMRPDKATSRDIKMQAGNYTFVMLRYLARQVGGWVKIDAKEHGGFIVSTETPLDEMACVIKGEKIQARPMECML